MAGKGTAKLKIDMMFRAIKADISDATTHNLNRIGRDIMKRAIVNAPIKTGYLVNSAFLDAPKVGFGWFKGQKYFLRFGFRANYALAVEKNHRTRSAYLAKAISEVWEKDTKVDFYRDRAKRQNIKRIVIDV